MIKAKTKHLLGLATALGMLVFAASCSSGTETEEGAVVTADTLTEVKQEEAVNYLYPATLASDWKPGNPQNIIKIQEIYKIMLSDSNYEATLPYFADSITNVTFDNRKVKVSKEEFIELVKKFRKGFKTLDEEFRSYVTLRSDALNSDMVLLWLKEKGTRTSGRVDSSGYQETWRFNDQGKIDYRSTFVRYDF